MKAARRVYSAGNIGRLGRPSLPPAVYFRLLLIGYFEGIDSERGIAWQVADSLALRAFLGLALTESPPGHSITNPPARRCVGRLTIGLGLRSIAMKQLATIWRSIMPRPSLG